MFSLTLCVPHQIHQIHKTSIADRCVFRVVNIIFFISWFIHPREATSRDLGDAMLESLLRARVLYGAVAMSVSVLVFSFLQEREQIKDKKSESAERSVSTKRFFEAIERMSHLTTAQRVEIQRFWRNLSTKKHPQHRRKCRNYRLGKCHSSLSLETKDEGRDDNQVIVMKDVQDFALEYTRVFPKTFPETQVLEAAEKAADAGEHGGTAWSGLVDSTSTMIVSTGKRLNHIAKDTKDEVQLAMHRTVRKVLESALDIVAGKLQQTLKDPDMPEYLKVSLWIGYSWLVGRLFVVWRILTSVL